MQAEEIIRSHPQVRGNVNDALLECIEACYDCAQACTACADACLGEDAVRELTQCIRLNLDCAEICASTGTLALRRTGSNETVLRSMLQACAEACDICATECERHASHHEHCRLCAEECTNCETACREATESIAPTRQ